MPRCVVLPHSRVVDDVDGLNRVSGDAPPRSRGGWGGTAPEATGMTPHRLLRSCLVARIRFLPNATEGRVSAWHRFS